MLSAANQAAPNRKSEKAGGFALSPPGIFSLKIPTGSGNLPLLKISMIINWHFGKYNGHLEHLGLQPALASSVQCYENG